MSFIFCSLHVRIVCCALSLRQSTHFFFAHAMYSFISHHTSISSVINAALHFFVVECDVLFLSCSFSLIVKHDVHILTLCSVCRSILLVYVVL